jgi:hypothetical protein
VNIRRFGPVPPAFLAGLRVQREQVIAGGLGRVARDGLADPGEINDAVLHHWSGSARREVGSEFDLPSLAAGRGFERE